MARKKTQGLFDGVEFTTSKRWKLSDVPKSFKVPEKQAAYREVLNERVKAKFRLLGVTRKQVDSLVMNYAGLQRKRDDGTRRWDVRGIITMKASAAETMEWERAGLPRIEVMVSCHNPDPERETVWERTGTLERGAKG